MLAKRVIGEQRLDKKTFIPDRSCESGLRQIEASEGRRLPFSGDSVSSYAVAVSAAGKNIAPYATVRARLRKALAKRAANPAERMAVPTSLIPEVFSEPSQKCVRERVHKRFFIKSEIARNRT